MIKETEKLIESSSFRHFDEKMRKKLPAHLIFKYLPKKALFEIDTIARNCGWDQPQSGVRYYEAKPLLRAIFLLYIKGRPPLDQFVSYLEHTPKASKACGFDKYIPSKTTISIFQRYLGYLDLENFFYKLVRILFDSGTATGRHIAIDSTYVQAWSDRASRDKNDPGFKKAKNCDFALLGRVRGSYNVGYRIHAATLTKSNIPIAVAIFPANIHDRRGFDTIFKRSLQELPAPLAISADKGYSSGKNRKMIQDAGAACFIRPTKTDLMGNPMKHFIPEGMSEDTYWKVYWRRNSVELTFAFTKGHCSLDRPRVVNESRVKQHVWLSFITHQFLVLASQHLNLSKTCFSLFF